MNNNINDEYFEWLCILVCSERFSEHISYRKLLSYLHDTEFTYLIHRDKNRESDGVGLRYRFCLYNSYDERLSDDIEGPCSVLEMMVALAIRCEESIMDDPKIGDRTGQWFWGMISSLGLSSMMDHRYDEEYVCDVIERFLNRDYEPNGKGGLFTIKSRDVDMRDMEIGYQLYQYLNCILGD